MKHYEHVGELFKAMRHSRKMTLSQVGGAEYTDGALSIFESTGNGMSFSTFYLLLQRMGYTLREFHSAMKDFELDDFDHLIADVREYYNNNRKTELKEIADRLALNLPVTKKVTYQKLQYWMVKSLLSEIDDDITLSDDEKKAIAGHLLFIEEWSRFELMLFGNTIKAFPTNKFIELALEAVGRTDFYKSIPENRVLTVEVLLNTANELISQDEYSTARTIISYVESLLSDKDCYHRLVLMFTKGALEFSDGNFDIGLKLMIKPIEIFEVLGNTGMADSYRTTYNSALKMLDEQ